MAAMRPGSFLVAASLSFLPAAAAPLPAECLLSFQRGDSNRDEKVDLSDPITTLGYLFLGAGTPGCLDASDADDNGKIDLSDAVFTVSYLFLGGAPIPAPAPGRCGIDSTEDLLDCSEYLPCNKPGAVQCTSNDCCDAENYCEKAVDDCDGVGTCVPRPFACPAIFDPWCGCDGVTYSSRCDAAGAGMNVVHRGSCDNPAGCTSNKDCEVGAYCARPEGACDDPGNCDVRPEGCPKNLDPVCGCDGLTYGNDCEAASSGASIAYRGECARAEPCTSNDDCDPEQYCLRGDASCELEGVCSPRPEGCIYFFDPICGCDGQTYDNVCLASSAGVNTLHYGPCAGVQQCKENEFCEEGSFCARREGSCTEPGFCHVDIDPAVCAAIPDDPICGCDEITYPNACMAAAAGVGVARRSPCEVGGKCQSNDDCVEAAYCYKSEGFCGDAGFCELDPRAEDCQAQPDSPVCGCDEVTYRNSCEAARAGMGIAYQGQCDGIPRCSSNADCAEDTYCAYENGACGGLGKCAPRPAECAEDIIDPVCGCDKRTYRNECFAAQAGISVAFRGSCNGGGGDCTTSALCGGGLYCTKQEGDCDGLGHCDAIPTNCGEELDPVCGCDGITYDNECKAHASAVNVLERGPCR